MLKVTLYKIRPITQHIITIFSQLLLKQNLQKIKIYSTNKKILMETY
jgi:hypothetical protein